MVYTIFEYIYLNVVSSWSKVKGTNMIPTKLSFRLIYESFIELLIFLNMTTIFDTLLKYIN